MIECIPNFSEGRRPEIIQAIADAIRAVTGAYVLDTHIDADHNRSVITFAGQGEAVGEAAFRAVEAAALLIDMRQHQGQHPRIGATDVLPFVPLRGATMGQCVELSRRVGQRISEMLDVPVYLYGAAATRPERRELPALRQGEYEGLRDTIARDPARAPDFGPARLGPAGATVVGAREPLIAYNLFLDTSDVRIAKRVARAVRGSSGGLRGVRALGMLVNGQAQVSMNLIDYHHTPVHLAVEMVATEAAVYGARITMGELVGLMPEDALIEAGKRTLRLPFLSDAHILERRLAQAIAEANERHSGRTLSSRLTALQASHRAHAAERHQQPTVSAQLDTIWLHSVHVLGTAVQELAATTAPGRMRSMLRVLARELIELAEAEREAALDARAQTLLLIARRAVKATEALTGPTTPCADDPRALIIAQLALSVTTTARLRFLDILPQLDDPDRTALAREFAIYSQRLRELLARIDPVV